MPKPRRSWMVMPHDPLVQHEDNLWSIEGKLPGGPIRRRMSIARRSDGTLDFFHAVPIDEETLAQVLALGKPGRLVVGQHHHAMDAHPFAEKLCLKIYGPRKSEAGLRERCDLAGFLEDLPADPAVSYESFPGTKLGDAVMIVKSGARQTIHFCDAVQNTRADKINFVFRLLGFGGGPKVVPVFRMLFIEDKAAMRAAFERYAALPGMTRIIPCHGSVVESGGAEALRWVAASLA